MGFLQNLFGKKTSKSVAKKRLQLVLIHDRSDLSPEVMENLRRDLIDVISNYMEVDIENIEMDFDKEGSQVALVASIPVTKMRRKKRTGARDA